MRPEWLAFLFVVGSGGRLELAVVGGSAAKALGVGIGHPVAVRWE